MNLALPTDIKKLIDRQVKSGRYGSAEEVISTAVRNLSNGKAMGDFAPGEMQALIEEGERDFKNGDVFEAKEVFDEIRRRSAERRGGKQ